MPAVATKTYVTPKNRHTTIGELIGSYQYGELIFIGEEQPILSDTQKVIREESMRRYQQGEYVDFSSIKDDLIGATT